MVAIFNLTFMILIQKKYDKNDLFQINQHVATTKRPSWFFSKKYLDF